MQLDKVETIRLYEETPYGFWLEKEGLPCFTFLENQKITSWIQFEAIEAFHVIFGQNSQIQLFEVNNKVRYQLLPQACVQHIGTESTKNLQFSLHQAATLKHFTRINSSKPSEESISIRLLEPKAAVDWQEGLYLTKGERKLSIEIDHLAPQTQSNCCVKSVLEQASKLQFIGNVYVQKEAEEAVAHQRNLNHVLDADSRVISLPNLHVFNRKIEASHGTATQPIPEEILFYLRSRGLSFDQAKQVYFDGFLGYLPLEQEYES
ncbi:MAG: SufB/SufD family protein [Opitutales bacterium]